ncbi:MAG: CsbD family protein [Gammaproteobacteria bacterium]|nr:CsbD family protein [Gammaproteobacteria bacterium]
MDTDIIKGKWTEIKGKVRQQWGKLTDDDISKMKGSYEELEGKLQQVYGYQKDQAKKEIDTFLEKHHWNEKV